jgi:hypothetical protein
MPRWDIPDEWEARRQGEREHEFGGARYSNPYDNYHGNHDRQAERAWDDGYGYAERRAEEEAHDRRVAERRREEREREEYEMMANEERAALEHAEEEAMRAEEEAHWEQVRAAEAMQAHDPKGS